MTTSLLISYPDIPLSALNYPTTSQTYDADYSVESLTCGERHTWSKLSSTQTSVTMSYDLGSATTKAVDHFILGNAKVLYSNGVTQATLQGSTDNSSWVNQLGTASAFQTRTFSGTNSKDLIFTAAFNDQYAGTLIAYRYWKVTLAGGSAHKFQLDKMYFGTFFDMGCEPAQPIFQYAERQYDAWTHDRGQVMMTKGRYPNLTFTIDWEGVTDAKAKSFSETILSNPLRHNVFLYAVTYGDPLADAKLVHARVLCEQCSITPVKTANASGWNNISAVFEEMI